MTIYSTNAALGYNQSAILIRLNKSNNGFNYLCIDTHNITDSDIYQPGKIVKDLESAYVSPIDYDIKSSPIYDTFLFQEFLNKKPNRNVREILPDMIRVSNNSILTNELARELSKQVDLKTYRDFKLWLKIVERKIISKEKDFRNNFFR
jgi:hypothetical protein